MYVSDWFGYPVYILLNGPLFYLSIMWLGTGNGVDIIRRGDVVYLFGSFIWSEEWVTRHDINPPDVGQSRYKSPSNSRGSHIEDMMNE